ncbi:MAG TPA: 3-deoxy-manno-octulosonate cytidylyltransferase [Solirubrobacteraceae bacterium]|nr:3-deoxy-manno-octulosonate cytidylyltransferase [Solirubrobacteraceae bacterium]
MATICFDLDGTLCTVTAGHYERAEPFPWAVERVNRLARQGHTIIIATARGTSTGISWEAVTRDQLRRWGVQYDQLHFGKPSADVFVDDRAVNTETWRSADGFAVPGLPTGGEHNGGLFADSVISSPPPGPVVLESGRTFGGVATKAEQHAARVLALARAVGIRGAPTRGELTATIRAAIPDAGLAGDVTFDISVAAAGQLALLDVWQREPRTRVTVSCRALHEAVAGLAAFQGNRTVASVAARLVAGRRPVAADEATIPFHVDEHGSVSSALDGALGVVCDGILTLDPRGDAIDVAADWLADLARATGVPIRLREPTIRDLGRASEVLIAGFPFCVLAVDSLDGSPLPAAPGPVTSALLEAWSAEVGIDVGEQLATLTRPQPQQVWQRRSPGGHQTKVRSMVVIPARLSSSRLPNKVLAEIGGRTMVEHVYEVAVRADCGPVVVLTDSEDVAQAVQAFGGEAWMTSPAHESGTARIASVVGRCDAEIIVNLQGDAPLTDPAVVAATAAEAASSRAAVTMPVYGLDADAQELTDPSVVKVVRGHDGRVLYCSRSAIPNSTRKQSGCANSWGHAGLYGYSRDFLRSFEQLPPSPLERAEQLEQLRWLEAGVHVHSFTIERQGPSVDTPVDLEQVRQMLSGQLIS